MDRILGYFGSDGEYTREDTHEFYEAYHGEAGTVEVRRYVGEYQGGSSAVSGRNPVSDNLHRDNTGGSGTVGGSVAHF